MLISIFHNVFLFDSLSIKVLEQHFSVNDVVILTILIRTQEASSYLLNNLALSKRKKERKKALDCA